MDQIAAALAEAFERLNDFVAVQAAAETGIRVDAVLRLQESIGIDDDLRAEIGSSIELIQGVHEPQTGQILYGLIVGLMAGQLRSERSG